MKLPQYKSLLFPLSRAELMESLQIDHVSGAKYIHATVNPDNSHSGQNFLKRGFAVKKTVTKYGGLTRNLLEYKVNS